MSKQKGLGRGLDSLIPVDMNENLDIPARKANGEMILTVDINSIVPNPHQPRKTFDKDELQNLAGSIKAHGILHPPVVIDTGDGVYELVAGERRLRAAKLTGMKQIAVVARSFDEQQKLELALLENVQRAELNPIDTAAAYRKLVSDFNLSLDQIGARMGKAKSTIANIMRLLELPKEAQDAVSEGKISEAHGRTLLAVKTPEKQAELLSHMINDRWSVRQSEEFVKQEKTPEKTPNTSTGAPKVVETAYNGVAQELADYLIAKVSIVPASKGGRMVIEYTNEDELHRIVNLVHPIEGEW